MTEEATTSDTESLEGAQEVSEAQVSETANTEVNENSSKDELDFDLSKVPEDYRDSVKDVLNEYKDKYVDKEFKRYLTKHTQERAEADRLRELEWKQKETEFGLTKQRYDQLMAAVDNALRDPAAYEEARRQAGLLKEEQGFTPETKFETVDDLTKYLGKLEGEIARLKSSSKDDAAQLAREQIAAYDRDQRVNSAKQRMLNESEIYKSNQKIIEALWDTEPELRDLYNGRNEYDVLKKAEEIFMNKVVNPISEKQRQQILESQKLKKTATTVAPQKNVSTKPSQGADTREAIISRIVNKYGY